MHDALPATRSSTGEDHPAEYCGTVQRHLLSDDSAEGEPKNITRLDAKSIQEGKDVLGHLSHRCRHLAGGAPNACIVEKDHIVVHSQRVSNQWVPVVERTHKVLQE